MVLDSARIPREPGVHLLAHLFEFDFEHPCAFFPSPSDARDIIPADSTRSGVTSIHLVTAQASAAAPSPTRYRFARVSERIISNPMLLASIRNPVSVAIVFVVESPQQTSIWRTGRDDPGARRSTSPPPEPSRSDLHPGERLTGQ